MKILIIGMITVVVIVQKTACLKEGISDAVVVVMARLCSTTSGRADLMMAFPCTAASCQVVRVVKVN